MLNCLFANRQTVFLFPRIVFKIIQKLETPTIKHSWNQTSSVAPTFCWVNISISVVSSLTWCIIICRSTFGCSRASLQMDFLTLWSVAWLRRAAACCVVQSVGGGRAPPQADYVNHIIMLFRSIDRPARRALPVLGQEPWGWRVTFAQHGSAGCPVGPRDDLSSWRAVAAVLTPAAPRWASEPWPFPPASLSDGGRLTASPKPPAASDITPLLVCCCQTVRYHCDLFSKPQLPNTPIKTL